MKGTARPFMSARFLRCVYVTFVSRVDILESRTLRWMNTSVKIRSCYAFLYVTLSTRRSYCY